MRSRITGPVSLRNVALSLVSLVPEPVPRKTTLYDEHVRLGAKIVPFAGWLMPVQYTSIVQEHQAVRNNLGIFDISHMGQLIVAATPSSQNVGGEGAAATWLNTILTNNVEKLDIGMGQYTFLLNKRAGIIDDLIVYRIGEEKFLLVVNAARTDEDFACLQNHLKREACLRSANRTDSSCGELARWWRSQARRMRYHPHKSQHGVWCSSDSRSMHGRIISCALRQRHGAATAKSHCRSCL